MTIAKLVTLRDLDLDGKTVLVRVDFNVPFRPGSTEISDDSRVRASLATIRFLADRRCKVILCSHVGRPKGRVVEELRVQPIAARLAEIIGRPVPIAPDCVGPGAAALVDSTPPGGLLMLENLRFHPGEEANDPGFAQALAALAQIYVNDAFGAAHRAHASTDGVARLLPAAAGFLMQREIDILGSVLNAPRRPLVAILGGAKVSDKIAALQNLVTRADKLLIGGGMGAAFLKANGMDVGASLVEDDRLDVAREIADDAARLDVQMLLPTDVVVTDAFAESASRRVTPADQIPPGWMIMDIGPQTAAAYVEAVRDAGAVIWNGPMGVSEWPPFAEGTNRLARALAALDHAVTVLGGGSTAEAVDALGLTDSMTHVSTGGGASLEFLEGRTLPGVAALMNIPSDYAA